MKMYNLEITRNSDGDVFIEQEASAEHKETVVLSTCQLEIVAKELLQILEKQEN